MSTVIRIKGANFNNPNLPVIPRLIAGQLKFSYKPSVENGFYDHSGQGDLPTKVGDPVLTDIGMTCGTDDGYRSQVVDVVDEFTAIAVFSEESPATNFMPIGCYDADNLTGWGVFAATSALKAIAFNSSGTAVDAESLTDYDHENGQWMAIRVTKTEISLFYALNGAVEVVTVAGAFDGRQKDTSNTIGIGASARSSWPTATDNLAEATFYQRALSDAEILKAYEYSSSYFNNHSEISV